MTVFLSRHYVVFHFKTSRWPYMHSPDAVAQQTPIVSRHSGHVSCVKEIPIIFESLWVQTLQLKNVLPYKGL